MKTKHFLSFFNYTCFKLSFDSYFKSKVTSLDYVSAVFFLEKLFITPSRVSMRSILKSEQHDTKERTRLEFRIFFLYWIAICVSKPCLFSFRDNHDVSKSSSDLKISYDFYSRRRNKTFIYFSISGFTLCNRFILIDLSI